MRYRRIRGVCIVAVLVCSLAASPVYAAPEDTVESLQDEQSDLKDQKSAAESELSSLQEQLETLMSKAADLEEQLIAKGQEISQAEDDLEAAEEKRQTQYEAMKLRIRYVYESGGDAATIEKILSSGDITSILTQAEYSQRVHEYDRAQLKAYAETVSRIADLEEKLRTEMADLQDLEAQYQEQQDELNATISSKRDEISGLDEMLQEAARKILAEQQRQAEEERRAAQEAEEQAAENGSGDEPDQSGRDAVGESDTGGEPAAGTDTGNTAEEPSYDSSKGGSAVSRAYGKLGKPYAWGAAGPDSFDCSGLVSYALTGSYVHTWTTTDFMTWTQVSDPQPGDICTSATHCGIYIGNGQMIHSPQTGDVVKVSPVHSGMIYVRY